MTGGLEQPSNEKRHSPFPLLTPPEPFSGEGLAGGSEPSLVLWRAGTPLHSAGEFSSVDFILISE